MTNRHPFDDLVDHTRKYIETRAELGKLQFVEKSSLISGEVVTKLIFAFLFLIIFSFISIAAALYLGEILGKNYYGFLIVGGFYAVISVLFYINRNRWIKRPVAGGVIRTLLKEDNHD